MAKKVMTEEGASTGFSRRKFLIGAGGVAGGLALAGGFGGALGNLTFGQQAGLRIAAAQNLKTDLDILQFALTLEHFENAAYAAANQSGLLTGQAADFFKAFGEHEAAHVAALTDVITKMGATPVAAQDKYYLPNLQTSDQIVDLFIQLEEVGAGAYLGAAPMIQDKALLSAAASIHDVEAQHASSLKALKSDPMPSPAFGAPLSYDEVIMAVTPFLTAPAAPPEEGYYTNTNPAPSLAVAVNRVDAVTVAGVLYYPETGHTLSGPFADYFNANGNLMQFGFPITEPYMGTNQTDNMQYVQQFFQRARMEWHPENKGTPFEVELGLLGAEQLFKGMMGGM